MPELVIEDVDEEQLRAAVDRLTIPLTTNQTIFIPFDYPYDMHEPPYEEDCPPEQPTGEILNPEPRDQLMLDLVYSRPGDAFYGQHIRALFQFFRRNAANRYSSSTLMRLANAAGEYDDRTRQGTVPSPRTSSLLPVVTVATRPLSYDEDTEVKSGGTVGMMVSWPDGKSLLAVTSTLRRQGIGRQMFEHHQRYNSVANPYFWVSVGNIPAQQFLLSMNLIPTALNGNGAVRYGYAGAEE